MDYLGLLIFCFVENVELKMKMRRWCESSPAPRSLTCWWRGTRWWSTSTRRSRSTVVRNTASSTKWSTCGGGCETRWQTSTWPPWVTVRIWGLNPTPPILGSLHERASRVPEIQYGTQLHLLRSSKVRVSCCVFSFFFSFCKVMQWASRKPHKM